MQDFRNLEVWKKAHALALDLQKTLGRSKRVESHIRAQMSRAATSIAANIVEGCGKGSRSELARFADISAGSSSELEYWLLVCLDLGQLAPRDHERLTASTIEVRKMLFGLRKAIKNGTSKRRPSQQATAVADA
jgi:four helix bundle protein